ncbi:4Fe-4S dicluster domain-containing protein [Pectinatus haikarae]|uniref:4Fe-4S dicluster domain-containing protein n=1 Tax=Pectinatus haikarae TaxID=349096 RepID=UPI0018C7B6AD|nr:hypothetical protein [Pectinatus haikarae]
MAKASLKADMSDKMIPADFSVMLKNIRNEYNSKKTVYGVPAKIISRKISYKNEYMDIEMPFGPAAGPHTQLAQNIAAGYAAGARFFELKTVQVIDGEELHINKPCISVPDECECYNIEWSTELTTAQAFAEYVKAYLLLKFMSVEFELGRPDGFSFNMSVGYDLQGIKSKKVDTFIENMKNAENTAVYRECCACLAEETDSFSKFSLTDLERIKPQIAQSITVSTMHGCPAEEIEKIAEYLMAEKKLPVYIKLNPTLNGLAETKKILADRGYAYIKLIESNFVNDLSQDDAEAMLRRLLKKAEKAKGFFGVKLTNTLPVAADGQLPDKQMYLSGKPLFLLSLAAAEKLAEKFGDELPVSFSGGLDGHNISQIFETGIYPLTMATVLLKGKGYRCLSEYADLFGRIEKTVSRPQKDKISFLTGISLNDAYYCKKQMVRSKKGAKLPLLNCKNCGLCITVCPNRANIMLDAGGKKQVVHIDAFCNECGSCAVFCPYEGKPYRAKFTVYHSLKAYMTGINDGMVKAEDDWKIRIMAAKKEDSRDQAELIKAAKKDMRMML